MCSFGDLPAVGNLAVRYVAVAGCRERQRGLLLVFGDIDGPIISRANHGILRYLLLRGDFLLQTVWKNEQKKCSAY